MQRQDTAVSSLRETHFKYQKTEIGETEGMESYIPCKTNEKKAGVRVRESDTIDQLSISTATAKSKKMKTKGKSL